jgi:hypothetical protein
MGLFSPGGKSNKSFNYEPRYYDPSEDEDRKRRMESGRRSSRRRSPINLLYLIGLLLFTFYIYYNLG